MAQLMPLPLTVSCFSKIQIGFTFLVPAHPGSPGKRAVKRVCVCVYVNWITVVVELFQVYGAGAVAKVDERLAVGPALNDDATRLRVERKQSAVEVTRCIHHAAEPPTHQSIVMQVHPVQLPVVLRIKAGRAVQRNAPKLFSAGHVLEFNVAGYPTEVGWAFTPIVPLFTKQRNG